MWAGCWRELLVITVWSFWGVDCVLYGHAADAVKLIKEEKMPLT